MNPLSLCILRRKFFMTFFHALSTSPENRALPYSTFFEFIRKVFFSKQQAVPVNRLSSACRYIPVSPTV